MYAFLANPMVLTIVAMMILAWSFWGVFHMESSSVLLLRAWKNGKKIRVIFLVMLLGPFAWIMGVMRFVPLISAMLTMYILQEIPDRHREEE